MLIEKLNSLDIEQVVFFCKTDMLPYHDGSKRIEMYADAGHLLGNHTHSHNRISELGIKGYIKDIKTADSILAKFPNSVKWFRFPFLDEGKTNEARDSLRHALAEMGYFNGYVTVDNYDWYLDKLFNDAVKAGCDIEFEILGEIYVDILWQAISYYDSVAIEALGRSPRHVLLLHENDLAALFIDKLVAKIRSKGWEIISPVQAYEDPIAAQLPDVLMNNQGRTMAIAREKGLAGPFCHESEDIEFLDKYFAEKGVFK
jgi:peptidoglycan/xylan/chitin deacetylase (PgdA/CDA1 family)